MSKLLTKAEQLYNQGFQPIPVVYKEPIQDNWQNTKETPNGNFTGANSIGIVLGREVNGGYLCAFDVDCYNKKVSNDFYEWICSEYGQYPFRVGTKPKFMIPFICDEQLSKSKTPKYDDDSQIEILGLGQQFVAYGFAGRGVKYNWYNGELDVNTLPRWSTSQLNVMTQKWEQMIRSAGMTPKTTTTSSDDFDPDDFMVDIPTNKEDITDTELTQLLNKLNPSPLDYDNWVAVGMALHHQTDGQGYDLWLAWSEQSDKHDPRHMKRKWASFGEKQGKLITLATIRMLINQQQVTDEDNPFEANDFPSAADITVSDLSQHWQVEHILEKGSIAQVYGPSYSGKSYFVMHLAASVASGNDFGDKRTIASKVIYVYGEGNHGIQRRLSAVKQHYPNLDLTQLHYSKALPNLMDEKSFLKFGKKLKKAGGADVIIFDTLARSMSGGDENSAMDMGLVLQRLAKLRDVFGCSVVVVHHSGKDASKGARGSSATYAGMDNEIKVTKTPDDHIKIESTKAKDSPEYKDMYFKFVPVVFDIQDNFGNQISSAAVEYVADYEGSDGPKANLSPSGSAVFEAYKAVAEMVENHVLPPPDFAQKMGLDAPAFGIPTVTLREQFDRMSVTADEPAANRRNRWMRGMQDAVSKGYLAQLDEITVGL